MDKLINIKDYIKLEMVEKPKIETYEEFIKRTEIY